jgi:hypothetical protein
MHTATEFAYDFQCPTPLLCITYLCRAGSGYELIDSTPDYLCGRDIIFGGKLL